MSRIQTILLRLRGDATRTLAASFARFTTAEKGNVAIVVAFCLVPILVGVGTAIDMARLNNAHSKVQADLDFALIAAVNEIGTEDAVGIEARLKDWFASQQAPNNGTFSIANVDVNLETDVVTATATGEVPTTLMGIVGVNEMPVDVTSSAKGSDKPHTQIFFALDKSASMMLAATPEGQAKMQNEVGCTFACHIEEGSVGSTSYRTFYDYSRAKAIVLRSDVAAQAITNSLSVIEAADPDNQRIKIGLTTIGSSMKSVLAPTLSFATVRQRLTQDSYGMTGSTSDETTRFDISLPELTTTVGSGGDGHLETTPKKFVLILTDGVQSDRHWVHDSAQRHKTTPLNPAWCKDMKDNGSTVAVLYIQYLPLTGDWGYEATLGQTMSSARWRSTWNGERRLGVPGSIKRHDYIPYALKDCASSENLFLSAASQSEIEKGIKGLLRAFLSAPRLTQ